MEKILLNLRVSPEEKARFTKTAKEAGLSLSAWIRSTLLLSSNPHLTQPLRDEHADGPVKPPASTTTRVYRDTTAVTRPSKLCHRCARIGTPSCDSCRKIP